VAQADDYSGGRIERVNLATGKAERLYDRSTASRCAARTTSSSTPTAASTSPTWARCANARWTAAACSFTRHADGRTASVVAHPADDAQRHGAVARRRTLYYAETEGARLWAFDITAPGGAQAPWPSPQGARMVVAAPRRALPALRLDGGRRLGNMLVATLLHGGISVISPDGSLCSHVPLPDRIRHQPVLRRAGPAHAVRHLVGHGKLIAIDDWPVPGLKLNFNA
jgi:gluconolactonase